MYVDRISCSGSNKSAQNIYVDMMYCYLATSSRSIPPFPIYSRQQGLEITHIPCLLSIQTQQRSQLKRHDVVYEDSIAIRMCLAYRSIGHRATVPVMDVNGMGNPREDGKHGIECQTYGRRNEAFTR